MAEPSNPNPEKLFQFTITPLHTPRFRKSFDLLIDRHFNPTGLGVIEVKEDRVDFLAQNIDTNAVGNLKLKSTALNDFFFNNRTCQGKLMRVNFRNIFDIFTDQDSITFSHFNGSDNIIINLGNDPLKVYNVRLLAIVPGLVERFPDIQYVCGGVSPSIMLRLMVNILALPWNNNQLASVDIHIQQTTVSVSIGNVLHLSWRYRNGVEATIGVVNHRGRFFWPHLGVLRKASLLTPVFELCYASPEMIMTLFNLNDLGNLKFVRIPPGAAAPADAPAPAAAAAAAADADADAAAPAADADAAALADSAVADTTAPSEADAS